MNQKNNIKTTTNRSEFNRKYKKFLADSGKIKCRYCKYNQGENNKNKWLYHSAIQPLKKFDLS